jgi:hypothetical protein
MAQCYMRCPSSADEWIMVEMQGELTSHEHTSFQNLTLGTLRVQDDVRTECSRCKISAAENQADVLVPHNFCSHQGVPHLEIGNHMLEGKFENLKKPLLVCQRRQLDPSVLCCCATSDNFLTIMLPMTATLNSSSLPCVPLRQRFFSFPYSLSGLDCLPRLCAMPPGRRKR